MNVGDKYGERHAVDVLYRSEGRKCMIRQDLCKHKEQQASSLQKRYESSALGSSHLQKE